MGDFSLHFLKMTDTEQIRRFGGGGGRSGHPKVVNILYLHVAHSQKICRETVGIVREFPSLKS